jgi:hypothetical protein
VTAAHSSSRGEAIPSPLRTTGPFGVFADDLLAAELPELPVERRTETVAFVCRRAAQIPTPLRLGVIVLTIAVGSAHRLLGRSRTTSFLRRTSLPLVGELARLVRSLGFAYVWETWPATTELGAPA